VTETAIPAATDLADLVRTHQVAVWRWLRSLGCPPADAEALAAETFVVAWRKGFVLGEHGEAAAFLRSTARFLWLRRQRSRGREAARFAAAAEALWERDCAADDGALFVAALRECLAALDGRSAEAVRLCYTERRPHRDAAARLGLKPNGLKTLLQRLRAALRRCIERRTA
jgi:RNA polymerase sigma factor (sigma-70 family)